MLDYQQKLEKLKGFYNDDGNNQKIIEVEKKLRKLIIDKELLENPVIEKIVEMAKEDMENIDRILCSDETLIKQENEMERIFLFKQKKWIKKYIVDRFSSENIESAITTIQKSIDAKEKRMDDFLKT